MATATLLPLRNNDPTSAETELLVVSQGERTNTHATNELVHRIDRAIRQNPHLSGHRVFCQEESGIVVLHGRVSSFFQKQMAQESLKRLEGVEKVINQLEVQWRV